MAFKLTNAIIRPVRTRVYWRSAGDGVWTNGEDTDWVLDARLRCESVRIESGTRCGFAKLTFVPSTAAEFAFEEALDRYTIDDQIKIVADPVDDQGVQQADDQGNGHAGHVLFVGVLARHTTGVSADGTKTEERVGFVAFSLPSHVDNRATEHLNRGRWIMADEKVVFLETPLLPAVFNHGGQPNMGADEVKSVGGQQITGRAFTTEDDPKAGPWTVRIALASVLAVHLYGTEEALCRSFDVDSELVGQLNKDGGDDKRPEQYDGLDAVIADVSVYGLHVLDQIEAVCRAGGFDFAVVPVNSMIATPASDGNPGGAADDGATQSPGEQADQLRNQQEEEQFLNRLDFLSGGADGAGDAVASAGPDRPYVLRVWRRNRGPMVSIDLGRRGKIYADHEAWLAGNNTPQINGLIDASEIVNEVYAVAPTYLEVCLQLLPLFKKTDMDGETDETKLTDPTEEELEGTGYAAKHVAGGAKFAEHKHVGRLWGLDCVGNLESGGWGDESLQQSGPFDFVEELGLNGEDWSALADERKANGLAAPIVWSNRIRRPLPLRSPEAVANNIKHLLEVSEDAGATWEKCHFNFSVAEGYFGVYFNSVNNLAAVCNKTMGTKEPPDNIADSWWMKIKTEQLRFRLTCVITADHAQRYDGVRSNRSGTQYVSGQLLPVHKDDVWVAGDTEYADIYGTRRIDGEVVKSSSGSDVTMSLATENAAERRLDALEDRKLSLNCEAFQMDFGRYQVGQRVDRISGRNFKLDASAGAAPSLPNIVGITYALGAAQSIEITLEDHRMVSNR